MCIKTKYIWSEPYKRILDDKNETRFKQDKRKECTLETRFEKNSTIFTFPLIYASPPSPLLNQLPLPSPSSPVLISVHCVMYTNLMIYLPNN